MSLITAGALTAVLALLTYLTISSLHRYWRSFQHGCLPAPRRVGLDRIFGLDLLYQDMSLRRANRLLPSEYGRFQAMGVQTYTTLSPGRTTVMTADTENIRFIFSSESEKWGISPIRGVPMGAFCGQGFLTADGTSWERSRALLKPSFNTRDTSNYVRFNDFAVTFMKRLPEDGTEVDLQPLLMTMFVDTSQDFLIGQPPGAMEAGKGVDAELDPQAYLAAFNKSLVSLGLRIITGPFRVLLPASITTQQWEKVYSYIDHFINTALDRNFKSGKGSSGQAERYSLLERLASLTADRIEIRNQVLQGMLAAQDTTPTLISNILFLLARHPAVWSSVRQSLLDIEAETVTADRLRAVIPLRNIIREALRLYPIFSRLNRVALADTELPTGGGPGGNSKVYVPKGTEVLAHFYSLHRNSAVFGADVEDFKPERWNSIEPTAWEYMPFGGGPRACLGQQKVLNETSYMIWLLARNYSRIEARDEHVYEGVQRLITKNGNGCKVALYH